MRPPPVVALAVLLTALSCSRPPPQPLPPAPVPRPSLDALLARERLAFRAGDPGSFASEQPTYDARVSSDGALRFTPWHHPGGARAGKSGAALEVETRSVSRGGVDRPLGSGRVGDRGIFELARTSAVEELENTPRGLEQRWRFAARPEGSGPLRVTLGVKGPPLAVADADGLHFGATGALQVLYSHATWVDAAGARVDVPARFVDGAIVLEVPASTVDSAKYPAVLDPLLSAELAVSTPTTGLASSTRYHPSFNFLSGGRFLMVWEDFRRNTDTDLFGVLVDPPDFTNALRFPVAVGPGSQQSPVVMAGPSVAWADERGLWYASIPTGKPDSSAPAASLVYAGTGVGSLAVPDNGDHVVMFSKNAPYGPFYEVAINTSNPGSTPAPVQLIDASGGGNPAPQLTENGSVSCLAFVEPFSQKVRYAVISSSTTLPAPGTELTPGVSAAQSRPQIATSPNSTTVIVWVDERNGTHDIYGTIMFSGCGLINGSSDPSFKIRSGAGTTSMQPFVATETDSSGNLPQYDVGTLEGLPDGGQRIVLTTFSNQNSDGGLPFAPTPRTAATLYPQLGTVDGVHLQYAYGLGASGVLAWSENIPYPGPPIGEIYAQLIGPSLKLDGGAHVVSTAASSQDEVSLSSGAGTTLVTWSEISSPDSGYDLFYRLLGSDAGFVDSSPTLLVAAPGDQVNPSSAFGPTGEYFVVWSDARDPVTSYDVWGARISAAGQVVGGGPKLLVRLSNTQLSPRIVPHGGGYLLTWEGQVGGFAGRTVVTGARLTTDGTVIDNDGGFRIFTKNWTSQASLVPGDGGTWVIAQGQDNTFIGAPSNVIAAFVRDADAGPDIIVGPADSGSPAAAATQDGFRAAWLRGGVLYEAAFDETGTPLGAPQPLESGLDESVRPVARFDGERQVFAWSVMPNDGGPAEIRAVWVYADGGFSDRFSSPASKFDTRGPSLAPVGGSRLALGYVRSIDEDLGAQRAFVMTAALKPLGAGCAALSECGSGFCVQGVCCSSACTDDCATCLAAGGTQPDGTCAPKAPDTLCRPSNEACDAPEVCDGVSTTCPLDALQGPSHVCRSAVGPCDAEEHCDGQSRLCAADRLADAGVPCAGGACSTVGVCDGLSSACPATPLPLTTVCRPSLGVCDAEEHCDGTSLSCPDDKLYGGDTVCRPAAVETCDVAETCTGGAVDCPGDVFAAEDTECGAAGSVCRSGQCVQVTPPSRYAYSCKCSGADVGMSGLVALAAALVRRKRRAATGSRAGRAAAAAVVVLTLLAALPAHAAEPRRKLVFMGIRAGAGVGASDAKALSGVVQSELASMGPYDVVSESDLQTLLGIERQRQLLGCSEGESSACMEELVGAVNADRAVIGDVACVGDVLVFNTSLLDGRNIKVLGRVNRRFDGCTSVGALIENAQSVIYELANQAPEQGEHKLAPEPGFGGFTVGAGVEGELLGRVVIPTVSGEYSRKYLGVALTVIASPSPGARLEARFYPFTVGRVRGYLGAGASALATGAGLRASVGVAVRLWHLQLIVDGAYERFVPPNRYADNAVLVGLRLAWKF